MEFRNFVGQTQKRVCLGRGLLVEKDFASKSKL